MILQREKTLPYSLWYPSLFDFHWLGSTNKMRCCPFVVTQYNLFTFFPTLSERYEKSIDGMLVHMYKGYWQAYVWLCISRTVSRHLRFERNRTMVWRKPKKNKNKKEKKRSSSSRNRPKDDVGWDFHPTHHKEFDRERERYLCPVEL